MFIHMHYSSIADRSGAGCHVVILIIDAHELWPYNILQRVLAGFFEPLGKFV
jgi:hypothetical protein